MRLRSLAVVSAGIAILALTLTACGTSEAAPVSTNHVDLPPSYLFSPSAIKVSPGTTVTWNNSDNFTHSVRLIDQGNRILGIMHPGQSVTFTFTAPGFYHYDCSFHPQNMKVTVTVRS